MAAIKTNKNEIDRKLHRIILDSDPEKFNNMMVLANSIERKHYAEFSYIRADETEYASSSTIQKYISYARHIGLLDGNLKATQLKKDIRSLENFQAWLSDTVFQYLNDNHCSIPEIKKVVQNLLHTTPAILPTQENIHSKLKNPPTINIFLPSLKIVSLLRPNAIRLRTRRVILIPEFFIA